MVFKIARRSHHTDGEIAATFEKTDGWVNPT
jgi:hypothetical protein